MMLLLWRLVSDLSDSCRNANLSSVQKCKNVDCLKNVGVFNAVCSATQKILYFVAFYSITCNFDHENVL